MLATWRIYKGIRMRKGGDMIRDEVRILYLLFPWYFAFKLVNDMDDHQSLFHKMISLCILNYFDNLKKISSCQKCFKLHNIFGFNRFF